MSHFSVLIIGDNPEEQLEPFDENKTVERYVKYTKAQLIEKGKKSIEDYKNWYYAEYLRDPEQYRKGCDGKEEHFKYVSVEFPEKLKWTDEQIYKDEIEDWEKEDIGPDGEVYSTDNPQSKWDYHKLGGRFMGFFKLKKGREGKLGKAGVFDNKPNFTDGADSALKKDIDFKYMIDNAGKEASDLYDKAMTIISHLPVNKTFDEIEADIIADYEQRKLLSALPKIDLGTNTSESGQSQNVRDIFWDQPRCKAWKEAENKNRADFPFSWDSSPSDFLISKDEYVNNARDLAICTFAIIKDGQWYERGEMGWWGCVHNEKDRKQWTEEFNKLISSLPDDTLLSIYDCHI